MWQRMNESSRVTIRHAKEHATVISNVGAGDGQKTRLAVVPSLAQAAAVPPRILSCANSFGRIIAKPRIPYAVRVIRRWLCGVAVRYAPRLFVLVFSPLASSFCGFSPSGFGSLASRHPSRDLLQAFSPFPFVLSFILFLHFFAGLHSRC
ncbi:hypothetical protein FA13DRAFT_1733113 [Coprinellus micaceus]|uniref:Transmembrane protein n=1 Tax=Coprinellus micaceus TaxID=71717 RepID=A0A4Y7TB05_COPMI|nr:hypothetical protein FA13DRAFT_1733113 [Coprinellus micaceus]